MQSRSKLDFQRVVNNDRDRKDSPRCGPLLFAKGHVEMIRRRMPPFPSGNVRRGGGMSDPPIGERRVTVSPPPCASAARVRRERARPPALDLQTGKGFCGAPCFLYPVRGASADASHPLALPHARSFVARTRFFRPCPTKPSDPLRPRGQSRRGSIISNDRDRRTSPSTPSSPNCRPTGTKTMAASTF